MRGFRKVLKLKLIERNREAALLVLKLQLLQTLVNVAGEVKNVERLIKIWFYVL